MFEDVINILDKKAADFPPNYKWLNTSRPLSLQRLRGHIVILDFWTYACINCMHMVPVLSGIEKAYGSKPVVIIGVHSAKFGNEADPKNILEAIDRYGITHPVVVDRHMHLWRSYLVNAWPTFVFIDPNGRVVKKLAGEIDENRFKNIVSSLLGRYGKEGSLAKGRIRIVNKTRRHNSTLLYPGKLSFSSDHSQFA
ncbi:MAG: redoxin domain-containing protein, partial [Candidatus Micrarchaeota archaeon]|nr:redoxin domain-containing protein [Candidatus Micrarchaeota archaeon]